jgi:hypothetical protein
MSDTATGAAADFSSAADLLSPTEGAAAPPAAGDQSPEALAAAAAAEAAKTATAGGKSWFEGVADPELKGWLENKNYESPEAMAAAHRGLEKLLGSEKVPLPKDEADAEGWDRVYKAIGRPDAPEGYGLEKLEGGDEGFAKQMAGLLFEAGVGQKQALRMGERWNAYMTEQAKVADDAFKVQSKQDWIDLQTEWGSATPAKQEHFRRGCAQFGVTADELRLIETQVGTKRAISLFAKIGEGLGEDEFIEGDTPKQMGMTPEAAKSRKEALMADKQGWAKRYLEGGADERAEMERLNKIINPAVAA